jgi:hypothetical protein
MECWLTLIEASILAEILRKAGIGLAKTPTDSFLKIKRHKKSTSFLMLFGIG